MITKPITVLLPVHISINFANFKKSINSIIYKQSIIPREFIIIIDGPVSSKILKYINFLKKNIKYADIKIIKYSTNKGLGTVLKYGVIKAKFNLILRCDSDDFSEKKRVETLYNFYLKNKNFSVIDSKMIENYGNKKRIRFIDNEKKNNPFFLKLRNTINHPTVLMQKKDILKVGNYENIPFFEDYFLWIKLHKNNYKLAGINKTLVNTKINLDFYKRRSGYKYFIYYKNFLKNCLRINFINKIEFYILILFRFFIILNNKKIIIFFYQKLLRTKK